jgi:hypothetical protein
MGNIHHLARQESLIRKRLQEPLSVRQHRLSHISIGSPREPLNVIAPIMPKSLPTQYAPNHTLAWKIIALGMASALKSGLSN